MSPVPVIVTVRVRAVEVGAIVAEPPTATVLTPAGTTAGAASTVTVVGAVRHVVSGEVVRALT